MVERRATGCPDLGAFFANVRLSLSQLHTPGPSDPQEQLLENDGIHLNPQAHRFFDAHEWFLKPLGRGSWCWISQRCSMPLSMAWQLERPDYSNEVQKTLERRPIIAAPMLASVSKILLFTLGTAQLKKSFRRAAGKTVGSRKRFRLSGGFEG